MEIYEPAEDSFLLEEEVKKYLRQIKDKINFKVLDMGSGSGIQAKAAIQTGIDDKNILYADINPEAIAKLKEQKLSAVKSNLFSKIKGNFNLIIFNAPYLPEDKYDKEQDTTAGKRGNEIILKFLKQAKAYLANDGVILLLFSSLSKPEEILKYAIKIGYMAQKLAEKSVGMMEQLFVYSFT